MRSKVELAQLNFLRSLLPIGRCAAAYEVDKAVKSMIFFQLAAGLAGRSTTLRLQQTVNWCRARENQTDCPVCGAWIAAAQARLAMTGCVLGLSGLILLGLEVVA